jgi:hypothetical protein
MGQSTRTGATAVVATALPSAVSANSALSGFDFFFSLRLSNSAVTMKTSDSPSGRSILSRRDDSKALAAAVPSAFSAPSALSGFDFFSPPRLSVSAAMMKSSDSPFARTTLRRRDNSTALAAAVPSAITGLDFFFPPRLSVSAVTLNSPISRPRLDESPAVTLRQHSPLCSLSPPCSPVLTLTWSFSVPLCLCGESAAERPSPHN